MGNENKLANEDELLKEIEEERFDNVAFSRELSRVDRDFMLELDSLFSGSFGNE